MSEPLPSLPFDEWHDLVDRIRDIIHGKLGLYLEEANAFDLAETEAAIGIVSILYRQEPEAE